MITCLGMPSVISTCPLMQLMHMLAGFAGIATPQRQHNIQIIKETTLYTAHRYKRIHSWEGMLFKIHCESLSSSA